MHITMAGDSWLAGEPRCPNQRRWNSISMRPNACSAMCLRRGYRISGSRSRRWKSRRHRARPPIGNRAPTLRMAFSERLCRAGGVVCGQALMALADTAMVIAILAANRGFRPMTTVDQTTHFLKAVASSDVLADARVVRLGRTMSFGRVTLSAPPTASRWRWSRAPLRCCEPARSCQHAYRKPILTWSALMEPVGFIGL